jgi:hypothetical protein
MANDGSKSGRCFLTLAGEMAADACAQSHTRGKMCTMHQAQRTERVRRIVCKAFIELGAAEPLDVRETILIRDGSYCGRRFEVDTACAIWFVEENQVKVYRDDGGVACLIQPDFPSEGSEAA